VLSFGTGGCSDSLTAMWKAWHSARHHNTGPSVWHCGTTIDVSSVCFVQAEKAPAKKKLGASSRKKKKSKAEVGACFVMHQFSARQSCVWRRTRETVQTDRQLPRTVGLTAKSVQFEIRC
jgi:hypothetical protein